MTEQKETADLLFDTATKLESTVFEMQELSDLLVLLHERIEVDRETGGIIVNDSKEELLAELNRVSWLCQIAAELTDALISRADALERAALNAPG